MVSCQSEPKNSWRVSKLHLVHSKICVEGSSVETQLNLDLPSFIGKWDVENDIKRFVRRGPCFFNEPFAFTVFLSPTMRHYKDRSIGAHLQIIEFKCLFQSHCLNAMHMKFEQGPFLFLHETRSIKARMMKWGLCVWLHKWNSCRNPEDWKLLWGKMENDFKWTFWSALVDVLIPLFI